MQVMLAYPGCLEKEVCLSVCLSVCYSVFKILLMLGFVVQFSFFK